MAWSEVIDIIALPFNFIVSLLSNVSFTDGVTLIGILGILVITSAFITYYGR